MWDISRLPMNTLYMQDSFGVIVKFAKVLKGSLFSTLDKNQIIREQSIWFLKITYGYKAYSNQIQNVYLIYLKDRFKIFLHNFGAYCKVYIRNIVSLISYDTMFDFFYTAFNLGTMIPEEIIGPPCICAILATQWKRICNSLLNASDISVKEKIFKFN